MKTRLNQKQDMSRKAFSMPQIRNLLLIFSALIMVLGFTTARAADEDRGPGEFAPEAPYVQETLVPGPPKANFKCPTNAKTGEKDPNCEGTTEDQPQTCQTCPTCKAVPGGLCDQHSFTDLRYEMANPNSADKNNHRGHPGTTTDQQN